jgi:myo-inositol-1(or 4)-monophosphatase
VERSLRSTRTSLVSEELGERASAPGATAVVVDPIDGSVNAKRGIPFFSFSLAVAEGSSMADVTFGYATTRCR